MVKFRPLHDRVLVRRVEPEQKTTGGLFIPETAKEKPQHAEVIAVGTGRVTDDGAVIPMVVKAGDRVLFARYGGDEIRLDGVDHLVLRESDILAVIES